MTKNDLFKMFNIKEATFQKWVGELDLPIKTGRFEALEIPANFESMYYKFLEGEVSKPKLLKDLNVSDRTLYTWIKGKGLPLKKDYTKNSAHYSLSRTFGTSSPYRKTYPQIQLIRV